EDLKDFGELPSGRYDFYKRAYERYFHALSTASTDEEKKRAQEQLPDHIGLQPYIVMEVYGRLKAAFREYRRAKIAGTTTHNAEAAAIFYAGWLGHFVADGSQPLHATIQYDGWTGENPNGYATARGIHAEFETAFVKARLAELNISKGLRTPKKV